MATVDGMSQITDRSAAGITAFSQRWTRSARARSAHEGVTAVFVSRAGDDTFSAKRWKAAQLPTVQSCQSGIFNELRHRETEKTRSASDLGA